MTDRSVTAGFGSRRTLQRRAFVVASVWLCSCVPGRASDPRDITPEGEYVHAPAGLRFPLRVGEFQREKVLQYDAVGNDVSVGYNLESPPRLMAATVYMYPLTARSFEDELASVQRAHASFALGFRQELLLERGGQKQTCQLAGFSYEEVFARQFGPVRSYLLVCDTDPWRIKWRFTHRSSSEKALTDEMRSLAAELSFRK